MMNHGDAERYVAVLEARICSLQEETELKIERGRETRVWPLLIKGEFLQEAIFALELAIGLAETSSELTHKSDALSTQYPSFPFFFKINFD